jgi:hypothetical protein
MDECRFYSDATRHFNQVASLTNYKAGLLKQAKRCNRTAACHSASSAWPNRAWSWVISPKPMIVTIFSGAHFEDANAIGRLCASRSANAGPDLCGEYGEPYVQATIEP